MIERFFPDREVRRVEDILLADLKENRIKGIILDIDNTISEWKKDPAENVTVWLEMLRNNEIQVCLVSNNTRTRVERLSRKLSLHAIHGAFKPRRKAFIAALALMGTEARETAVVGDQLFTDVYGGNRLNMYTIYVNPISEVDQWFVRIKRPLERYVLSKYRMREFKHKEKRMIWKERSGMHKLRKYVCKGKL